MQDSFAKVAPIAPQAADLFYGRLFEVAPQVRSLFPDDLSEQKKKLMGMLAVVVNGLDKLDTILPAASALAKRHVGYGAAPEHYPVVGGALLWTLEKGLGEGVDTRTRRRLDRRLRHAVGIHDRGSLSEDAGGGISDERTPRHRRQWHGRGEARGESLRARARPLRHCRDRRGAAACL